MIGLDRLLDASVLLSFDGTGYRRHARSFDPADMSLDLTGQEHVVTGANAGIGRVVAETLAARGARVWMVCRNPARGEEARDAVRRVGRAELVLADVSVLADVRRLADGLPDHVHALVHNAGVLLDARDTTPEGLERTFATHVGGPFLLTALLAPRLAAGARVVWVSSGGMYTQRLDVPRLLDPPEPFDGVVAYARCKRAQVILADRWAMELPDVWVGAMHPGWADTGGVQRSLPTFRRVTRAILRTPAEGADTVSWLAARVRGPSGRFWFDRREVSPYLVPGTKEAPEARQALWEACRRAVGLAT